MLLHIPRAQRVVNWRFIQTPSDRTGPLALSRSCRRHYCLSNGEKLNPVGIEDAISEHPAVKGALVVGQDRFQPALILEPVTACKSDDERAALIEELWPLVNRANKVSVRHGHIIRSLITISDPIIPFIRSPKGTVQRKATVQAYKGHISDLYARAADFTRQDVFPLNFDSEVSLGQSIVAIVASKADLPDVQLQIDLFSLGIDSLQVISLVRAIAVSSHAAGYPLDHDDMTPKVVYSNPTPHLLAKRLFATVRGAATLSSQEESEREIELLSTMVEEYTKDLPQTNSNKPNALNYGQTVLLTGSTGSLGAHLLSQLCASSCVTKIVALNREGKGQTNRQLSINTARGLATDFSKVEFLPADLSLPDLGLGLGKYHELLVQVDRVIHTAWPVNFNLGLASFRPQVLGVRHLVEFSSKATKCVPIVFTSSISTVSGWSSIDSVPEQPIQDLSVADMGYGRSKLAASLILDAARLQASIPSATIRVGQIAGSKAGNGIWNKQEFIPTLIASSFQMGILPDELGPSEEALDWMPIEDVATVILEVSLAATQKDIDGYFNLVNPAKTTWRELATHLQSVHADRIELVSLQEWVRALERDVVTTNSSRNPAIKLLDTYRGMLDASKKKKSPIDYVMTKTLSFSPTLAKSSPITPQLLQRWCSQWDL